jgi:hypothetical protein
MMVEIKPLGVECSVVSPAEGELWQTACLDAVVEALVRGGDCVIFAIAQDGRVRKLTIEEQQPAEG